MNPAPFRNSAMAALLGLTMALATPSQATDAYPNRPIRMVVAFAPGGPTDILARLVAAGMTKALGQQVVVDNKAGAGGALGTHEVAKARADGYTVLFAGDAALTVQPQLTKGVGYDGMKDFTPLRLLIGQRNVLVSNKSKGIVDIKSLVAGAKIKPDALSFGSAGNGSPSHLIGALFEAEAGVSLLHVPYRGAAPAMTDLLGGQVDMMFVGMPVALQSASRPEIVLMAVTGDKRSESLPNVPTFAELGIKGLGNETTIWWGLTGPSGLPADVRAKLVAAADAALNDPAVRKNLEAQGVDVLNQDASTLTQWIVRDTQKWGKLIRNKNITE